MCQRANQNERNINLSADCVCLSEWGYSDGMSDFVYYMSVLGLSVCLFVCMCMCVRLSSFVCV